MSQNETYDPDRGALAVSHRSAATLEVSRSDLQIVCAAILEEWMQGRSVSQDFIFVRNSGRFGHNGNLRPGVDAAPYSMDEGHIVKIDPALLKQAILMIQQGHRNTEVVTALGLSSRLVAKIRETVER